MFSLAGALDPGEEAHRLRAQVAAAGIVFDASGDESLSQVLARNRLPDSGSRKLLELPGRDWIAEDLVAVGSGFVDLGVFGLAKDAQLGLLWAALGWLLFCEACKQEDKGLSCHTEKASWLRLARQASSLLHSSLYCRRMKRLCSLRITGLGLLRSI